MQDEGSGDQSVFSAYGYTPREADTVEPRDSKFIADDYPIVNDDLTNCEEDLEVDSAA